ncbi:Uncharacterised protein [Yersinia nurmii]|uniref:Uncharacterized protein n=1 Tax=Yersinia nurmii TaxID=685706 RepID=A0ABP1YDF6_9GAMM|nr:Uncharacterised protein [Yersinia nurmii]
MYGDSALMAFLSTINFSLLLSICLSLSLSPNPNLSLYLLFSLFLTYFLGVSSVILVFTANLFNH